MRAAIFSACPRLLTKIERRARVAHVLEHERRDRRPDRAVDVREIVDRRLDRELDLLDESAVDDSYDDRAACARPTRKRAISSSGRCVADRPMRCGACSHSCSRRSSVSARCAPRFVPAIAWISSTITARTPLNIPRPRTVVSMMCSDSGVVMRMCGDLRIIRARADCGVSPVRTATRISGNASPAAANRSLQLGERQLEVALDVVVERLERRDVEDLNRVRQRLTQPVDDELIQLPEERRERLAGAGGRENERVRAAGDRGPSLALRRAGRAERSPNQARTSG